MLLNIYSYYNLMINKKIYSCPLCLKDFGNRKDNYQSHLDRTGCGIGIIRLEEIKKQLEEMKIQNEEMKIKNEKNEIDIIKLKEENESLKKQTIVYNNCKNTYNTDNSNSNNTYNINNYILQVNNFDDTKCEVFIQNLLKYMGLRLVA